MAGETLTLADLLERVEGASYTIKSREHPDEREARLRKEEREHKQQLQHNSVLLYATLAVLATTFSVCLAIIVYDAFASGSPIPDGTLKLAESLLTAVIGGVVGYVTGRATS